MRFLIPKSLFPARFTRFCETGINFCAYFTLYAEKAWILPEIFSGKIWILRDLGHLQIPLRSLFIARLPQITEKTWVFRVKGGTEFILPEILHRHWREAYNLEQEAYFSFQNWLRIAKHPLVRRPSSHSGLSFSVGAHPVRLVRKIFVKLAPFYRPSR